MKLFSYSGSVPILPFVDEDALKEVTEGVDEQVQDSNDQEQLVEQTHQIESLQSLIGKKIFSPHNFSSLGNQKPL